MLSRTMKQALLFSSIDQGGGKRRLSSVTGLSATLARRAMRYVGHAAVGSGAVNGAPTARPARLEESPKAEAHAWGLKRRHAGGPRGALLSIPDQMPSRRQIPPPS